MTTELKAPYIGRLGITSAVLYTCPLGKTARVVNCTVVNSNSSSAVVVSMHKSAAGEKADETRLLMNDRTISAGQTHIAYEVVGQVLEPGMRVFGIADVAARAVVVLDVAEITA